jgi:hypothetical protein
VHYNGAPTLSLIITGRLNHGSSADVGLFDRMSFGVFIASKNSDSSAMLLMRTIRPYGFENVSQTIAG